MKAISLADLRFDRRSHRSALWWLGLLYRKPRNFVEASLDVERGRQTRVAALLYLHQLPYMLAICVLSDILSFYWFRLRPDASVHDFPAEILVFHGCWIVLGVVWIFLIRGGQIATRLAVAIGCAITGGVAWAIVARFLSFVEYMALLNIAFESESQLVDSGGAFVVGIFVGGFVGSATVCCEGAFAITLGLILGVLRGVVRATRRPDASGVIEVVVEAARVGIVGAISIGLSVGIAYGVSLGAAVGFGSWIALAIPFGVGYVAGGLRAYYNVFELFFSWSTARGARYRYFPAAWDDLCSLTFGGLHRLLVAYHGAQPAAAEREINRLIDSYPSQRHEALWADTIIVARRSAELQELSRLDEIVAKLSEGGKGFLAQTRRLRRMVHEIASCQARLDTLERPLLREPLARFLCQEIERFRGRVAGFHQPLAREFRAAAGNWLEVAQKQLADAQAVLEKEPTRQVFRAGDPVDREREAFVPRNAVSGEIERQVMLATGCPGIVLYGRRRTGKSTVLRNLDGFLPPQVLRAGISMQKPSAFTSLSDFVTTLTDTLTGAVEGLGPVAGDGDLRQLFRSLQETNERLEAADRRLLLSIDEYENLDRKIGQGVFPEDLLATLRESIQTHRHITWIFAGSHEITELPSARWTSYLVSARTVEVEPFTAAETRLLLTEPLKHSNLWSKEDPTRPRFAPGFWGEGGIERIHAETGGWPHLVQLVAETVVDLLNDDRRMEANAEILERALDKAIVVGHNVLYELMHGESTLPGEWDYLAALRGRSAQPPPADAAVARSLRRRLLVAEDGGVWRLRVPLMERWLRLRG